MSANDLGRLFSAHEQVKRWTAERENASARLELAQIRERSAHLLSQHEPVASLGLDREALRVALNFLAHGDLHRLGREHEELRVERARKGGAP